MPNINELFPSKWLRGEDFELGERRNVTIHGIGKESVGNPPKEESVLYFTDEKPMILKVTNGKSIAKLLGDDYSLWHGNTITLIGMEVSTPDGIQIGVRVSPQLPGVHAHTTPAPAHHSAAAPDIEAMKARIRELKAKATPLGIDIGKPDNPGDFARWDAASVALIAKVSAPPPAGAFDDLDEKPDQPAKWDGTSDPFADS